MAGSAGGPFGMARIAAASPAIARRCAESTTLLPIPCDDRSKADRARPPAPGLRAGCLRRFSTARLSNPSITTYTVLEKVQETFCHTFLFMRWLVILWICFGHDDFKNHRLAFRDEASLAARQLGEQRQFQPLHDRLNSSQMMPAAGPDRAGLRLAPLFPSQRESTSDQFQGAVRAR